jgi:hypothetical protein
LIVLSGVYICFHIPCIFCGWISILVFIYKQGFPLTLLLAHILYIQSFMMLNMFRLRHVKILNFIDCTMNSKYMHPFRKFYVKQSKPKPGMKLRSLRKSLPSQICSTLTLHDLICDSFSSILHSSCTMKDTTVIFLLKTPICSY